ncbi:inositol monophosphatase [Frankia sp. Cpl3]|nr:inositol monophosphatase [Frankia sp. Cpl3]
MSAISRSPGYRWDAGLDLDHARVVAVEAAETAGAMLRGRALGELGVAAKGSAGDLATVLDTAAEEIIRERIRASFPDHRIRGEEGGASGPQSRWEWLIDPLDGTNNIAIGMPNYVVGVALCSDRQPTVGVVHDPVAGRTWSALRGGGMHGPRGGHAARARAKGCDHSLTIAWTQGYQVGRHNIAARALKYVLDAAALRILPLWAPLASWSMLARDDIDGFIGYCAEEVDLPAGYLLAVEAGVTVLTLDGGHFDGRIGQAARRRSFVAARPGHVDTLLSIVKTAAALEPELPDIRVPGLT